MDSNFETDRRSWFIERLPFVQRLPSNLLVQADTKKLVGNGQIEFVNGGWCMADNASPSMDGEIDQVTLGHRYV